MIKYLFILSFVFLAISPSFTQSASLAESVEYDPVNNRFISGNDAVSMIQQDPIGNLSYFGQGLASNLGIEVMGNYIFCIVATMQNAPINTINVYDLTTETFVSTHVINNAILLNGMASDGVSKIWVTDFQGSAIYEVDFSDILNPVSAQIAGSSEISNQPNGITYDESQNRLVFVSWNDQDIRQLDLSDNTVSIASEGTGTSNMDGIDLDQNNNFYVSSWTPVTRITKYSNDFSSSEVLNIPGITNVADLCVAKEINIIALPSFQHNVILWDLGDLTSTASDLFIDNIAINTFPNPSKGMFNLDIKDENWNTMDCQILDPLGRLIKKMNFEYSGKDNFQIDISHLENGSYYLNVILDQKRSTTRLVHIAK